MSIKIKENCEGCGDCIPVCPQGCLEMQTQENKVVVKPDECIDCNACIDVCTHGAIDSS